MTTTATQAQTAALHIAQAASALVDDIAFYRHNGPKSLTASEWDEFHARGRAIRQDLLMDLQIISKYLELDSEPMETLINN